METIIIDSTDSSTTEKIKDFLKELNVTFKTKSKMNKEKLYDPALVKKILDRAENAKKGNTTTYDETLRKELFG